MKFIKGLLKKRKAKRPERGIYLQDRELQNTVFQPGANYKYIIDSKSKKIIIVASSDEKDNTVSKRVLKETTKPVIDIRKKDALELFNGCDYLQVEIFNDKVIVEGYTEDKQQSTSSKTTVLNAQKKVVDINQILSVKKKASAIIFGIEKERDMVETYKSNIGEHIVHGDITEFDKSNFPSVPIIIGGSPCKGFSNANRISNFLDKCNRQVKMNTFC
ncbi:DNA cytosine methyltransferase [Cytobacillus sp. S13-E01]|uniref:DNA cytosine methyltransferase n=1 Tax=Cytobacillus sp. S13-E01 TaxID=3031326 RepID=UPI0023D89E2E|nr:DNA cytosine methyltransferase [Cytobacillus sp. S13-E01]MDF0729005.1 DNA cytosine methyltransferase [Cytobacillus sp. S13-E01]